MIRSLENPAVYCNTLNKYVANCKIKRQKQLTSPLANSGTLFTSASSTDRYEYWFPTFFTVPPILRFDQQSSTSAVWYHEAVQ